MGGVCGSERVLKERRVESVRVRRVVVKMRRLEERVGVRAGGGVGRILRRRVILGF